MSKGKRQKDYERSGQELGKGWVRNSPPKLSRKDLLRKMIEDNKNNKR